MAVIIETSHLRHIANIKPLSSSRTTVGACFHIDSVFYFGFFKHVADGFAAFFKERPSVNSIFITNDKKSRFDTNIYFLKVSQKELIYEEETESKLIRFVYNIEKDEVFLNQSVVYNPQTKQKFMKKIQAVAEDVDANRAFIFES